MPLVIITGLPSSGKTSRANELKTFFDSQNKNVHIVSESDAFEGTEKNSVYKNPAKEKEVRGILKSRAQRLLDGDSVVILDAGNYIKGYRYELYCMSKECKTTQITVHCQTASGEAWSWNQERTNNAEKYTQEVHDALVMRYEAPDSRNRWDSPLFTVLSADCLPTTEIMECLFERKAPPPNKSTQCQPISSTNFLYEMDKITQNVVSEILSAYKIGAESNIKIKGSSIDFSSPGGVLSAPQLARLRRQFLSYTKMNPPRDEDISAIPVHFVQFLNHRVSE
ncbi:protein KTI12 homolog [Ischnura elegans]|uniref:protein KTI12 homolog n=1 Tax=Ischnura elegans TaxID=197161 RepID=UPI001ED86DCE|nr:protein KTI12 homolog [Ischnura elegans]